MNLTHLQKLEAESIHIIREVAAEFDLQRTDPHKMWAANDARFWGLVCEGLINTDSDFNFVPGLVDLQLSSSTSQSKTSPSLSSLSIK